VDLAEPRPARCDEDELRIRGILRHGTHDQSSHGRKGPRGLAKAAAKTAVKVVTDSELGRRILDDIESASTVDQVVVGMRRHKAANPDLSTHELITAADRSLTAKYPQLNGFYAKTLAGREADIDQPSAPAKPKPVPPQPRKSIPASGYATPTATQMQARQDGSPPPWTGDERRALRYYTGNSAVANGVLRGWIQPPGKTATDKKKIEAAQRNIAVAKSAMRPVDEPLLVYRTTNPDQFGVATAKEVANLTGHTMTDRGFLSTSLKKSAGVGGKIRMEIEIPAGTPAAFVKSVSKYPFEDEVLLPPGMKYTILSVSGRTVRVRVEPA
jgi:hypothetical protein